MKKWDLETSIVSYLRTTP